MMGGNLSHEIHIVSDIGDDTLQCCSTCDYAANKSIQQEPYDCKQCKSTNLKEHKGIEVNAIFTQSYILFCDITMPKVGCLFTIFSVPMHF